MDDPGGQRFGLAPIRLAAKAYFDGVYAGLAQRLTDYSFANTYIWGACLKLYWKRHGRHLCVFANGTGDLTMFLPPLPEAGATEADLLEALEHCFRIMDACNQESVGGATRSRIEYVSDEALERINAALVRRASDLLLSASPMSGDYVYAMARMIDLAGGDLKSKRHARAKFLRDFPAQHVEDLADTHLPACLDLMQSWQEHGDACHQGEVNHLQVQSQILRQAELLACQRALTDWRPLGLRGMTLWVGDRLAGFTLGEALGPTMASILIEKTHPDFPGAAQFIFSEFCRRYWSHLPECNAGDDWGIPSLRFTKQSYRPIRLLSKHTLARAGVPVRPRDPATPVSADATVPSCTASTVTAP